MSIEVIEETDNWDVHWPALIEAMHKSPATRYRWRLILNLLGIKNSPDCVFVDVGCGEGSVVAKVKEKYPRAKVYGIDISEGGLRFAAARTPSATFIRHNLFESVPEVLLKRATHILCSEVIEHLDEPIKFLSVSKHLLSDDGRLLVTVPRGPLGAYDRHIGHRKHYTMETLRGELTAAGFEVERIYSAGFPFFNLYRALILARGDAAVGDAQGNSNPLLGFVANCMMWSFRILFLFNLTRSPWGWQLVAIAKPKN